MDIQRSVNRLSGYVNQLVEDGVANKTAYREWLKHHPYTFSEILEHEDGPRRPKGVSLVNLQFIDELDLIGFNYSNVAHNVLHSIPGGWTDTIRVCRGILFDRTGRLVALPFPKFFNDREHPETRRLPRVPFVARKKMDGHLGIIFHHQHKLWLTTRGVWTSRTSVLGREMLDAFGAAHHWSIAFPPHLTVQVEVIHPDTYVLTDYQGQKEFVLIGAYDRTRCRSLDDIELEALGRELHLRLPERWNGTSVQDLRREMMRRDVENEEGYVARFNDLFVKFKYRTYIGKMVGRKLGPAYIMKRIMAGNLRKMVQTLPEEGTLAARDLARKLRSIHRSDKTLREKRKALYALSEEPTSSYKATVGKFLRWSP